MTHDVDRNWLEESIAPLRRGDSSGLGSGLSRAIAAAFGIDVILVRVAFIALTFCAGLGLALYAWGTLLTPGPHGTRPIDSTIAGYASWSRTARLALVLGSSFALVIVVGASTSLPWGLALLASLGIWWLLRRARGHLAGAEPLPSSPAMDENELIDQWRRETAVAVGRQVAKAPATAEPPIAPARHPSPQPVARTAWMAGLLLIVAAAGVGALCVGALGMGVAASLAVASIALGAAFLLFTILSPSRRLPRPLLAFLLVPLVACGWLATGGVAAAAPAEEGTRTVRAIATSTTVDLTDMPATGTFEIVAVASDVTVIVPGVPEGGIATTNRLSSVDVPRDGSGTWPARLVIDATASSVTVVEEEP